MSFTTDWLFPTAEMAKVQRALREIGADSKLIEIDSPNGHDAFLVDYDLITPDVSEFLAAIASTI